VVLGLGNPIRRDDAAGLAVVQRVAASVAGKPFAAQVTFKECCAGPLDLLDEIAGFGALVVVDSWYSEASVPGRVRVLDADELVAPSAPPENPHMVGLPQALAWAGRVGMGVPRLCGAVVVEVGAECMEFGEGLTEAVSASIPSAARKLEELVLQVVSDLEDRGRSPCEVNP
jgi:hydrogenase maturation protease